MLSVVVLVAIAPVLGGQAPASCGTDSVYAKAYGAHLQQMYRGQGAPDALVEWVSDSASCHTAMRVDSSGPDERVYVFSLRNTGVILYGVLTVPPPQTQASQSICFYDGVWRRRGVCLGEVQ